MNSTLESSGVKEGISNIAHKGYETSKSVGNSLYETGAKAYEKGSNTMQGVS